MLLRTSQLAHIDAAMQLTVHIADSFDTLASGKVLAVGLFPDRVVVMNVPADAPEPTAKVPFGTDLGLLLALTDAPIGSINGEVRILPPEGAPCVGSMPFGGLQIAVGSSVNILVQLRPLLVPHAGVYTVEVQVGSDVLFGTFEVRINRLPPVGAAPEISPTTERGAGGTVVNITKRRRAMKAKP